MESVHESTLDSIIEPGTEVFVTFNTEKINLFTADGTTNILEGVENDALASSESAPAAKRLAVG
jgi:iron(III) transport system ATP-binding protein